ncbi:hypothetical protein APA_3586 [Pseudanabaena sp. lw0831]|nr:hypothetical protein APA_3586 [Pseudanabaena sp. lw0831]
MKIGVGLQDNVDFYQEVVEAYKGAASIYEHEGNKEAYSAALISAAIVAQKAQSISLATDLFLKAEEGYKNVADAYWNQKKYELAWDNMQLAYRCLKSILINTGTLE